MRSHRDLSGTYLRRERLAGMFSKGQVPGHNAPLTLGDVCNS